MPIRMKKEVESYNANDNDTCIDITIHFTAFCSMQLISVFYDSLNQINTRTTEGRTLVVPLTIIIIGTL